MLEKSARLFGQGDIDVDLFYNSKKPVIGCEN